MNTHHDILEAARKGEVGKAANCGYYGARPQTILSLISRGLLQPTYPAVGEVRYRLTEKGMRELKYAREAVHADRE